MKSLTDTYQLYNGITIPCIGFGTWQAEDGETATQAVAAALSSGYRHIDTAAVYGNESSVGTAMTESGIPRKEIFLTSKLWNEVRGYNETIQAFEESLTKLQTDYMDLYLIHWPNPVKYRDCWEEKNAESWKAMEHLYNQKKIRAIGISNFKTHHMEALAKTAEIAPMVNQIRLCPGVADNETINYCNQHNMLLEAYSPFGTGSIFESEVMADMAAKYKKSIAQICLRWSLQKGYLPLPKSVTPERIKDNTYVFDFELTKEHMDTITNLTGVCRQASDPDATTF